MGHHASSQTEVYTVGEFPTVVSARADVLDEIATLDPDYLHRNGTGAGSRHVVTTEVRMSE